MPALVLLDAGFGEGAEDADYGQGHGHQVGADQDFANNGRDQDPGDGLPLCAMHGDHGTPSPGSD